MKKGKLKILGLTAKQAAKKTARGELSVETVMEAWFDKYLNDMRTNQKKQ